MSIADTLEYITLGNPLSRALLNSTSSIMGAIGLRPKKIPIGNEVSSAVSMQMVPANLMMRDLVGNNYNFIRLAGLGGASAIFIGAYCKYILKDVHDPKEKLESQGFADTANRIHFLHSFALMCMPLAHYPVLTGVLMTMGTVLFSGCMYYRALTGEKRLQQYATIGGFCLMAAWLSLVV